MEDTLIIKITDISKGDTLTDRACGNWDMTLSRAQQSKRAIVIRHGIILNVYKIKSAMETDEPAKITKANNRVRLQLEECSDFSYLIGKTYKTATQNPVTSISIDDLLNKIQ